MRNTYVQAVNDTAAAALSNVRTIWYHMQYQMHI